MAKHYKSALPEGVTVSAKEAGIPDELAEILKDKDAADTYGKMSPRAQKLLVEKYSQPSPPKQSPSTTVAAHVAANTPTPPAEKPVQDGGYMQDEKQTGKKSRGEAAAETFTPSAMVKEFVENPMEATFDNALPVNPYTMGKQAIGAFSKVGAAKDDYMDSAANPNLPEHLIDRTLGMDAGSTERSLRFGNIAASAIPVVGDLYDTASELIIDPNNEEAQGQGIGHVGNALLAALTKKLGTSPAVRKFVKNSGYDNVGRMLGLDDADVYNAKNPGQGRSVTKELSDSGELPVALTQQGMSEKLIGMENETKSRFLPVQNDFMQKSDVAGYDLPVNNAIARMEDLKNTESPIDKFGNAGKKGPIVTAADQVLEHLQDSTTNPFSGPTSSGSVTTTTPKRFSNTEGQKIVKILDKQSNWDRYNTQDLDETATASRAARRAIDDERVNQAASLGVPEYGELKHELGNRITAKAAQKEMSTNPFASRGPMRSLARGLVGAGGRGALAESLASVGTTGYNSLMAALKRQMLEADPNAIAGVAGGGEYIDDDINLQEVLAYLGIAPEEIKSRRSSYLD